MKLPTHIIDPDGEVVILLRNADCPFAQPIENMNTARATHINPEVRDSPRSPAEANPTPKFSLEHQQSASERKRMAKKKKKSKKRGFDRNSNEEPVVEEFAAEYPVPEEPVPEEPVPEEPVPEEPNVEEPNFTEPNVEEFAAEDSAAEYPTPEEPDVEESAAEEDFTEASNSNIFRIQVSAKHMILASPVFKNMLTGGWKESITFAKKGSVEVDAESWNLEALLVVLRAIHGQHYNVPQKITLEMLAQVAVIADYYKCKEPLHILKDIWIRNLDEKIPKAFSRDLVLWLWISWFFQLPSQFKVSTSIAMSHSDGRIGSWGLPVSYQVIGKGERSYPSASELIECKFADSMNIRREEAIDNLITLLHETRDAFIHGNRGCCFECRSVMYGALTMQMHSNNLLSPKPETPFTNLAYHSLVRRILAFTSPQWESPKTYSSYQSYRSNSRHDCPNASFESIFMMLNDYLEGLELELRMFTW
ncbi:hypothetical protein N7540_009846 [Penicillium herquei]|nr:hypothetical protein N7540_009846 [Penicillium herquei]